VPAEERRRFVSDGKSEGESDGHLQICMHIGCKTKDGLIYNSCLLYYQDHISQANKHILLGFESSFFVHRLHCGLGLVGWYGCLVGVVGWLVGWLVCCGESNSQKYI
jgi:hypothetical protein